MKTVFAYCVIYVFVWVHMHKHVIVLIHIICNYSYYWFYSICFTGVAAVHLGAGTCNDNTSCKNDILNDGTSGVVGNPGNGSPNLLLYCD